MDVEVGPWGMGTAVDRSGRVLWAPLLAALTALATGHSQASTSPAPAAGPVAWAHDDSAHFTEAAVGPSDASGAPSVIVSSGTRNALYGGCVPGGNPSAFLNLARDSVRTPAAKVVALNAVTGVPRWEEALPNGADQLHGRSVVLFQSSVADVDGDHSPDLLTVTGDYDFKNSSRSEGRTTVALRDPASGALRWQQSWSVPAGVYEETKVELLNVSGQAGGVLVSARTRSTGNGASSIDSTARVVRFTPRAPMTVVGTLPIEVDTHTTAVTSGRDGELVLRHLRLNRRIGSDYAVDLVALGVVPQAGGGIAIVPRWAQTGSGSGYAAYMDPAYITNEALPKVVTVQINSVVAYDLRSGAELWRVRDGVGLAIGAFALADLDADGVTDAVAGSMDEVLAAPRVVGVDGRTGEIMWSRVDALGKRYPLHMSAADFDGDGRTEVIATALQQEGTPCDNHRDDQGAVSVHDGATGALECRLPTDRAVRATAAVEVPGTTSQTLVAPTLGGTVYGFRKAEPSCSLSAAGP